MARGCVCVSVFMNTYVYTHMRTCIDGLMYGWTDGWMGGRAVWSSQYSVYVFVCAMEVRGCKMTQ